MIAMPIQIGQELRLKIARGYDFKPVKGVPWAMIKPHEAQALINHDGQSLDTLARRAGLDVVEATAILRGVTFQSIMDDPGAGSEEDFHIALRLRIEAWEAEHKL